MAVASPPPVVLRFGVFELDPVRWELRRNGVLLDLQQQPCRLLYLLASHAQQEVSREQIREYLWPGVAVDFNTSINNNIKCVREALGDDANNPRFIKTLRGQGYCFIAPLLDPPPTADEPATAPRRRWLLTAITATVVIAGVVGWRVLASRMRTAPPLTVTSSTVLAATGPAYSNLAAAGPWVYYSADTPASGMSVFRAPIAGGAPQPIRTGLAHPQVLAVSPGGRHLVLDDRPLVATLATQAMLAPSTGGVAKPFGAVRAPYVAWRPDDSGVAYSNGSSVWLADAHGLHPRELADFPHETRALAWSADGRSLAVEMLNQSDSLVTLWTLAVTGGKPNFLARLPGLDPSMQMIWLLDQPEILLDTSRSATGVNELVAVSLPAPGAKAAITVLSATLNYRGLGGLTLDAHGRVLVSGKAGYGNQVLRWDAATRAFEPFLHDARDVAYSPHHARIAYVRVSDNTLWVARADGSQARQLTQAPLLAMLPRWSPDGTRLAFAGYAVGHNWRLYLVAASGQDLPQPLTDPVPGNGQGAPTWTPDGKTLIYANDNCTAPSTCGVHRLDLATGADTFIKGSAGLRTARLSPDGRWIAALASGASAVELYDTAHSSAGWRTLWRGTAGDFVEWSADSRCVYVDAATPDTATIERLPVPGGPPQTVATYDTPAPQDIEPITWLGLAPGNTPLLAVVSANFEILALTLSRN